MQKLQPSSRGLYQEHIRFVQRSYSIYSRMVVGSFRYSLKKSPARNRFPSQLQPVLQDSGQPWRTQKLSSSIEDSLAPQVPKYEALQGSSFLNRRSLKALWGARDLCVTDVSMCLPSKCLKPSRRRLEEGIKYPSRPLEYSRIYPETPRPH